MAYYEETKDEVLDPSAPQTSAQGGIISGQGSGSSSNNSANSAATPDNPQNFVGITQYLNQNKPQAAKLAENVGQYVRGQGEAANTAISEGQGSFNKSVDDGRVGFNQDVFDQAVANPYQVSGDASKKAEFEKMRDAQYKGPRSLEEVDSYTPINLAVKNALGASEKTKSSEGRASLLADILKANKQKVSRGVSNLDGALLSVSPDSKNILSQARDSIAPIDQRLKDVSAESTLKAQAALSETDKTRLAIQNAFSGDQGVQKKLENSLKEKSSAGVLKADSESGALLNKLKQGSYLTDSELKLLNLTRSQYKGLVSDAAYYKSLGKSTPLSDLSSFATKQEGANQINPQNVASAEDYAKYSALNDLMGTSNNFLSDKTQAGMAKSNTLNFDYSKAPNAVADRINNFQVVSKSIPALNKSFPEINKLFNVHTGSLLGGMIDAIALTSKNGDRDGLGKYYDDLNNGLQAQLNNLGSAYGSSLKIPSSYLSSADKKVRAAMWTLNSKSKTKTNPTPRDYDRASKIVAYTTFLDEIKNNPSLVFETGVKLPPSSYTIPPPNGQVWL